jgi:hypothetical protein
MGVLRSWTSGLADHAVSSRASIPLANKVRFWNLCLISHRSVVVWPQTATGLGQICCSTPTPLSLWLCFRSSVSLQTHVCFQTTLIGTDWPPTTYMPVDGDLLLLFSFVEAVGSLGSSWALISNICACYGFFTSASVTAMLPNLVLFHSMLHS